MLRFIRRLLGRDAAGSEDRRRKVTELTIQGPARRGGQRASDAYFANMAKIQGVISRRVTRVSVETMKIVDAMRQEKR